MPGAQGQAPSIAAALELDSSARLVGQLSVKDRGDFLLADVELVQGPAKGGKVSVKPGAKATLYYNCEAPEERVAVQVDAIAGSGLTLRLLEIGHRDGLLRLLNSQELNNQPVTEQDIKGSTAEHTQLLREVRTRSLLRVSEILKQFLQDLVPHLIELSAQAGSISGHGQPLYDGANSIRQDTDKLRRESLDVVASYFAQLCPPEGGNSFSDSLAEPLDLVDLDEFEHDLAIKRMVTMGEEQHALPLEALIIRTADLIGAPPLKVRLPIHPRQLSQAFQASLSHLDLPPAAVGASFDFFARKVVRKLDPLYAHLNGFLAEHGIQPDIENTIREKGSVLRAAASAPPKRRSRNSPPLGQSLDEIAQDLPPDPGNSPDHPASSGGGHSWPAPSPQQAMYQSIIDALNLRRGLGESVAPAGGGWAGSHPQAELDRTTLADARTVATALSQLQRDSQAQAALREASSLRAFLNDRHSQLGALQDTSGLSDDTLNQLELVDNLFGTIQSELNVNAELKSALNNLHIPLAKLALQDHNFFVDRDHVARAMVDKLSALAASANYPNKVLEERINTVVDEIVNDFDEDHAVFARAVAKIDQLAEQQQRAVSRNVERVVRTQEGQEKLSQARRAVTQLVHERIQAPVAPKALVDLLDCGFRDLLVLTHIKEGTESQVWADQINSLDLLVAWLGEAQAGDVDEELAMQRSMEAESLLDMLGQQITAALPTNVSHESVIEELRDILAHHREIETVEIASPEDDVAPTGEELRARASDRLRRWLQRVEQLQLHSWLSYRDSAGDKRRMQLAWISEARDRFIFVDERGHKTADLDAVKLARKLSQGAQAARPVDALSVVDKSIFHTLEQAQQSLSFARNHDTATQLVTREVFLRQIDRALQHARRKQAGHALLYIDIDQFDLVNQVYDRVSGDQVLLEFSRLLAQLHGKKCSSSRLEGDSFAVLLIDRDLEQAAQLGEKIRADIAAGSLEIDAEKVSFTVSIGVAPLLEHSPDAEAVLQSARTAMRYAKEQGRDRVEVYSEDQQLASQYQSDKHRSREDLEQALATDRFVLRAQPIVQNAVDGDTPQRRHYELLLALRNRDGSVCSPEEFINSAERYGFMSLVDRWVVREAFSWISELMDAQKEVPNLAINLSGTSVTDDSFMEYLFEQISEFGVGTSLICFEITETATISNLVKAADFVQAFRNIGCQFSIDDFGTGYADHNYLRELPVDFVKIDGSFVANIHQSRGDYAMARSINELAHMLGQETIAESVENNEIVTCLKEIGVDYLQGWGIGKPKLLADITADLSNIAR